MRVLKALFALILVVAILGAAIGTASWVWFESSVNRDGPLTQEASFTVERGEGLSTVAARLQSEGIIVSADTLKLQARLSGTSGSIKAGAYQIPARASVASILEQLVKGDVIQMRLTIPEGLTTAQILRRIEAADNLVGDMPEEPLAEGILLPDTYIFGDGTTRTQFINRMKQAQIDLLEELWPDRKEGLPISTPQEAIILASVVEKETGKAEERGMVAGLFVGRLLKGMRLESDPTIIYGVSKGEPLLNRAGQRRTLYRSEIDRKTDWNTYQIDGLPKTPICNPGADAIAAVLNPEETEYVFFVADGTGGHLFAKTYAEHQRNVAAYRQFEREEIARERGN
ncbi:MAG: hypothetical protein Hens3KO_06560 [Henriciella sp.]